MTVSECNSLSRHTFLLRDVICYPDTPPHEAILMTRPLFWKCITLSLAYCMLYILLKLLYYSFILLLLLYYYILRYRHTNQRKAIIAALPFRRVQLMNHRQSPARARNKKTNTLQQPMLIRGHTHARPEPRPTGLCEHPNILLCCIYYIVLHRPRPGCGLIHWRKGQRLDISMHLLGTLCGAHIKSETYCSAYCLSCGACLPCRCSTPLVLIYELNHLCIARN
jgi:hypothetical protein